MTESPDINSVLLTGTVEQAPAHAYDFHGRPIYGSMLRVERLSGAVDYIPLMGERGIITRFNHGERIALQGRVLSLDRREYPDSPYSLTTRVEEFRQVPDDEPAQNSVHLSGHICRQPYARKTPRTNIDICELTVAVKRPGGDQDYCVCVAWDKAARIAALLEVGAPVDIVGRFQSREFIKTQGDGSRVRKMAHEISISSFE